MVGGYTVIDIQGKNISSPSILPGVYKRVESSMKPFLVQNFSVSGVEQGAFFATKVSSGSNFILFRNVTEAGRVYSILVSPEDSIQYRSSALSSAADPPSEDGPSASM